jgi:hypothetical protein
VLAGGSLIESAGNRSLNNLNRKKKMKKIFSLIVLLLALTSQIEAQTTTPPHTNTVPTATKTTTPPEELFVGSPTVPTFTNVTYDAGEHKFKLHGVTWTRDGEPTNTSTLQVLSRFNGDASPTAFSYVKLHTNLDSVTLTLTNVVTNIFYTSTNFPFRIRYFNTSNMVSALSVEKTFSTNLNLFSKAVVASAGSSEVNGNYTNNNSLVWHRIGGDFKIQWDLAEFPDVLSLANYLDEQYYLGGGYSDSPWTGTWELGVEGNSPAPTVTLGGYRLP